MEGTPLETGVDAQPMATEAGPVGEGEGQATPALSPQQFLDQYTLIKERMKVLQEELNQLEAQFVERYGLDLEYPVQVDGKLKHVRIYEPEGRFVYNTRFEVGLRVTPKNKASEVQ